MALVTTRWRATSSGEVMNTTIKKFQNLHSKIIKDNFLWLKPLKSKSLVDSLVNRKVHLVGAQALGLVRLEHRVAYSELLAKCLLALADSLMELSVVAKEPLFSINLKSRRDNRIVSSRV